MANKFKKIWSPRKVADNQEISVKQKHMGANIKQQRNKLDLKEKHWKQVENWLKNKNNEYEKWNIKDG